jgi:FtsZ-binding cell division protein ZapB
MAIHLNKKQSNPQAMSTYKLGKEPNIEKAIIAIIAVVVMALAYFLSGCNPTKRAYNGIGKHEPQTTSDTLKLAKRFRSTFKPEPPKVIPGKTIVRTITKMDTSKVKNLQQKVDSLLSHVKGCPNLDSLKKVIIKQIADDCKPKHIITTKEVTDTIIIESPTLQSTVYILNQQLKECQSQNEKLTEKLSEMKDKRNYWRIRFFILLGIVLLYIALKIYRIL